MAGLIRDWFLEILAVLKNPRQAGEKKVENAIVEIGMVLLLSYLSLAWVIFEILFGGHILPMGLLPGLGFIFVMIPASLLPVGQILWMITED